MRTLSCELSGQQPILEKHKKGYAQLETLVSSQSLYTAFCICKCLNALWLLWDLLVVAAKKNYPCKWGMLILLNYRKPLLGFFKWDTSFILCALFWENELKRAGGKIWDIGQWNSLVTGKSKCHFLLGLIWLYIHPNQERETDTDAAICSRGCSDHSGKISTSYDSVICPKQIKFQQVSPSHPQQQHLPKYRKDLLYGNEVLCLFKLRSHWVKQNKAKPDPI